MLSIYSNTVLTSLTGLDSIAAGSITDLSISDNSTLSTCEVESICNYLSSPSGTVLISGNAGGCNSTSEVEDACSAIGVKVLNPMSSFATYPTPALTKLIIESPATGSLFLSNLSGKRLLQQEITQPITTIDVSMLSSGFYFVRLTGKNTVKVGKFLKQ